ncbi:annexin A5-like [Liolophura sinensis]|uniref:annexin A5-like n=1 Tax=Liolophura sinensis TaxID=3198878 RepID=UPI003158CF2B
MAAAYFEGTVLPAGDTLDVEKAAERLRKAMKGLGTDENVIIDVLSNHCNSERQMIKSMYKTMYGRVIIHDLQDELSGHFETLCLYFLMPSRNFDAHCLYLAMKSLGTKESTLIEILVSRTPSQLEEIRENYRKNYGHELEAAIKGETSGDLERVLVSLLQGQRSQEPEIDVELVKKDAEDLYNAGEGNRMGTDETVFNKILVNRSMGHLRRTFEEYRKLDDQDIEGAVAAETSGNLKRAFLAIVRFVRSPLEYFAECFHESFKGSGTDDERLMQLVVSHSEVDMKDIKRVYAEKYSQTLYSAIKGETSGDYRKLLLSTVGE